MSEMSRETCQTAGESVTPMTNGDAGAQAPALTLVTPGSISVESPWWRIADFGVLGLWMAVVGFILPYHEKWCDEAQAWLFARDLSLHRLWFYELRYEGSPGLWHTILWIAQHVFHARYNALGYIGAACAVGGAALLIFKAPFPRYIRWPLAFTYFMVYQYAVIARQYNLLPVLAFAAALMFSDFRRPLRMAIVLMLLAVVSFHGTLLAGSLGLAYLVEALPQWRTLDKQVRTRYWISIALMVLTFVFVFIVLKPPPDSLEMTYKRGGLLRIPGYTNRQGQIIDSSLKLTTVISGAFFDHPIPSAIFLLLAGAWCFYRRKLLVFALGVGLEIALYSLVYGTAHHHGTVFVAAITGLWVAWPSQGEQHSSSPRERWALRGMIALLLCLCAVNIWDAAVAIKRDYLYPYSGAEDAASYLKAVGADHGPIFGYGFGISAVQANFDHNILTNIPTSYIHNGKPPYGFQLDLAELERVNPEYVVVFSVDPQTTMRLDDRAWVAYGYQLVHFSDGYYFYKRGIYEREAYIIYRRAHQ